MSSLARSSVTLSTRMPRAIRCRAPSLRRFVAVTAASGKHVIATDKAVAALGPYSQAIKHGNTIYVSGQIGLDPKTGEMVGADVESQTERVMQSMGAILNAAGADHSHVVKCTIFLTNIADFAKVNAVYAKYFTSSPPARATVEVPKLPRGALVEIDAVAML